MPTPLLVVVLGPTAVGKTSVAIKLAKHFQTEIISADSRQLFRELPIGTASPSHAEMEGIPHHFIGNLSVAERSDAGQWAQLARKTLDDLFEKHSVVICAGGSGLYINALLNGMDELPERDDELRAELQNLYNDKGITALQEKLRKLDPEYYTSVDQQNHKRLIRGIEVCMLSGGKYSEKRSGKQAELPFHVVQIGLELDRELLYERINLRVDQMMAAGLEAEARSVIQFRNNNALATVGYRELFDYFDGKTTLPEAVELIKQHSRNYAKRQLTWWRRDPTIKWLHPEKVDDVKEYVARQMC